MGGVLARIKSLYRALPAAERSVGDYILEQPEEVLGAGMLGVALAGLAVNVIALRILAPGASESLNMAGALRHVAADLAGSVGAVAAAIVIIDLWCMTGAPFELAAGSVAGGLSSSLTSLAAAG